MSQTKTTIEVEISVAQAAHIQHLQDVISKKNKNIQKLEEQIEYFKKTSEFRGSLDAAYKQGWIAATEEFSELTTKAARTLGKLRAKAFDVYLESQRTSEEEFRKSRNEKK